MSGSAWELEDCAPHLAQVYALRVAQEAAACVPAYARFLRLAGYDVSRLRGFADFCALPPMDWESYLLRYPLAERCRQGDLTSAYTVITTSGTAGQSTLWPRYPEHGPSLFALVREMLQAQFHIERYWTLVVACMAMGPWAFGTGFVQATQEIFSQPGMHGTVVTPGLSNDEALLFVEQLGSHYDQTLVVGYPTMIPVLLKAGQQQGIDWPRRNTAVMTAGEGATEAQRNAILDYLGRDPNSLEGYISCYGSTEAGGLVAYESHLCLLLRRLCGEQPALAEALFGTPVLPTVVQYNPATHFFQVEDDEILLTMRGAAPLIRYNTRDRGGLLRFDEVVSLCRAHGYDLERELRARGLGPEALRPAPLLFVHGRSDGVTVNSVNVYLYEMARALDQPALRDSNTGNFEVSVASSPDGRVTLRIVVELREGIVADDTLRATYQERVLTGLTEISRRFRANYEASRERTSLEIGLVPFGTMQGCGPKRQRVILPSDATSA